MMRSCNQTLRNRRGYLIVEVMATLVLLGIALGGLVPLLVTTVRGVDQGRRATAAANLGQDKVEQIRNTTFANVTSGTDSVTQADVGTIYSRSWTVAANSPTSTTKTVTVNVSWTDRTSHQVALKTIVGQ